ncbi:hypothetical protein Cni_G01348 [Canna indica]|uniref:Uncharacterized protein n=1 Tax=Canna indica TaxID=4628 RepID=A0AAQ3JP50_9LILI|nr:hypothetical protein Cni_G01348 [Canna indica]
MDETDGGAKADDDEDVKKKKKKKVVVVQERKFGRGKTTAWKSHHCRGDLKGDDEGRMSVRSRKAASEGKRLDFVWGDWDGNKGGLVGCLDALAHADAERANYWSFTGD